MTILDKVSFDAKLLRKEYQKAVDVLTPEDSQQLASWVKTRGFKISEPPIGKY